MRSRVLSPIPGSTLAGWRRDIGAAVSGPHERVYLGAAISLRGLPSPGASVSPIQHVVIVMEAKTTP